MKIYDKKKFWSGLGILAIGILFFFYDLSSPSANGFQAKWNLILGLIVMAFGIADSARALSRKKDAGSANRANGRAESVGAACQQSEDFGHYAGVTVCGYGGFFGRSEENRVSPLCRHGPGRGTFRGAGHFYRAFCGNVLRREEIGKGRRTMSKHMRPVYDERDDEIDAHSKSRAWDFVVVCIEVFTILCVVKGNTAWIGCLALLFAGMAANMMYRFDEYEERAYFHGGLILGAIGLALLIWFGVCG
ncbi:MAG: hypothetical protein ACLTC3_09060 [Evtepia gabavorous]